jgi:polyferredoxin
VTHRSSFIAEALRDRNALYRIEGDGHVENAYTLKIVNKRDQTVAFRISIAGGPEGAQLQDVPERVEAPPSAVMSVPLTVAAPDGTHGLHKLQFIVESSADGSQRVVDSRFFGPSK